jgi:hypothetical protein
MSVCFTLEPPILDHTAPTGIMMLSVCGNTFYDRKGWSKLPFQVSCARCILWLDQNPTVALKTRCLCGTVIGLVLRTHPGNHDEGTRELFRVQRTLEEKGYQLVICVKCHNHYPIDVRMSFPDVSGV